MAAHAETGRLAPGQRSRAEPALEKIIRDVAQGADFALPGPLCGPVLPQADRSGAAARVLMAMLWMASDTLKRGSRAVFQAPLSDLRHASGFTSYKGNGPVRNALAELQAEVCAFPEGDEVRIFEDIEIVKFKDLDLAQWEFTREFAELFDNPARFAVLSIRHLASMAKGVDVFLYREAMLVRKMRKPEFRLPAVDLHRVCEIDQSRPFKRVVERVRRSVARIEAATGLEIMVEPIQERGSRCLAGLSFRVSGGG